MLVRFIFHSLFKLVKYIHNNKSVRRTASANMCTPRFYWSYSLHFIFFINFIGRLMCISARADAQLIRFFIFIHACFLSQYLWWSMLCLFIFTLCFFLFGLVWVYFEFLLCFTRYISFLEYSISFTLKKFDLAKHGSFIFLQCVPSPLK